jgi:hypothetical protein
MISRPCFFIASNPELTPELITVVAGLLGLLTILVLVLNAVSLWQRVFGRRPPIEVDLQAKADRGTVEKLEVDIKGFASTRDLERYQEETRVRARGLEEQISGLRHELRDECQSLKSGAELRDAENKDAFRDLHNHMSQNNGRMSAVQKQADMILASLTNLDAKVDRVVERRVLG